jgi:hypothetical protein
MKPRPQKPRIIIAQVEASGTAAEMVMPCASLPSPLPSGLNKKCVPVPTKSLLPICRVFALFPLPLLPVLILAPIAVSAPAALNVRPVKPPKPDVLKSQAFPVQLKLSARFVKLPRSWKSDR